MKKKKLQLLGIWNQLPFSIWVWHCDAAKKHFFKLTSRNVRTFINVQDELSYQCFLPRALSLLKSDFERLNTKQQITYINRIAKDYYTHAKPFELYVKKYHNAQFRSMSDNALIGAVRGMMRFYPAVTMQAWYAVVFDIWYPSPETHKKAKRIIGAARDHLGHLHAYTAKIDDALLKEFARRANSRARAMYYLSPDEIIRALQTKEPLEPLAQQRMKLCVVSDHTGRLQLYHGQAARRLAAQYDIPQAGKKKQRMLRGTPAQPGKVVGKVCKMLFDKDFPKFKKGEILVALQTMVHYVPLMKKSKAILTEFGGLTSHAAIVSRELGKPCIVGIPNLIASLKDGDRVEVDADKGVVRKVT